MVNKLKIIMIIIGIALFSLFLFYVLPNLLDNMSENHEEENRQWDAKYKPVCEGLNGLYLEQGYTHSNHCYLNSSGYLVRYCMVQKLNNWYLINCGF